MEAREPQGVAGTHQRAARDLQGMVKCPLVVARSPPLVAGGPLLEAEGLPGESLLVWLVAGEREPETVVVSLHIRIF